MDFGEDLGNGISLFIYFRNKRINYGIKEGKG